MLKAAILDDEPLAVKNLKFLLEKYDNIDVVHDDTSPDRFLSVMKSGLKIDVVFVDIRMPGISGLDVARAVAEMDGDVAVVFCTAHDEYALPAFDVNATDYLLKPVDRDRLDKTVARLLKKANISSFRRRLIPRMLCLGKFEIETSQGTIRWPSRKSEEVVAFLHQNYDKSVHKEQIIENLWPDSDLSAALVNLQSTIYRARKALAPLSGFVQITYHKDYYRLMFSGYSELAEMERISAMRPKSIAPELASRLEKWHYGNSYLEANGWLWSYPYAAMLEKKLSAYLGPYPD
ncbi:MAG: response regulator [Negativicutes bacterium]|nr:response regulator [Negativicutes bacterium]